jgi:hypothetical protein
MDPIYEAYTGSINEAKSITIKDIGIPEYLNKLKAKGINFDLKKTKAEDWEIGVLNDILNTAADAPGKDKRKMIKKVIGYLSAYGKPYTYMEDPKGTAKLYVYDKQGKEAVVIS